MTMPCCEITIRMARPHLRDLPPVTIPDGYALRNAWPGFEETWVRLINEAFGQKHQVSQFAGQFVGTSQFGPEGVFFVFSEERPVATAFAWLDRPDERVWGRVHWVGVVPDHRGKGLGRAVTVAVMQYLAEHGLEKAYLSTEPFRLPAIRMYLSLGFEPAPRDEQEQAIWKEVLEKLAEHCPQRLARDAVKTARRRV